MRELVKYIMHRRHQALMLSGVLGGLSQIVLPLSLLSSAIVSLFLLRRGEQKGLYVLIGSAIVTALISIPIQSRPGFEYPFALLLLVPVYICSRVLRVTEAQGLAVAAAGGCGIVAAIAVQLISGDAVALWSDWLKIAVQGVRGATYEGFENNGTIFLMNGIVATVLVTATILSILIARWMQSTLYNPGGFKKEFLSLQIPKLVLYDLAALLIVLFMMNRFVMYDVLIITAMIYAFQGLAIIHYTVNKKNYGRTYLFPPYLLLFFMPKFVIVGLACLGATDVFINYRKLPK